LLQQLLKALKSRWLLAKDHKVKKIVMGKVLGNFDLISSSMPQSFLPPNFFVKAQELVARIFVSL
jgi:hypothetical protein